MPAGLTLSLLCPGIALAGHAMNEGNACYDCHELRVGYGEPDTSFLGTAKRNMSSIKSAWAVAGNNINGKHVPDEFGCLYCHNSPVLKDDPDVAGILYENKMRDASNHFRGKTSAHPVGYDLTTSTDKSGHLLSTFDCKTDAGVYYGEGTTEENKCAVDGAFYTGPGMNDGRGDRAVELDCVDCHDVTQSTGFLGYPQHGVPLATNPLMLRAGAGGYNLSTGEYDDHCRRCHGSATGAGATGIAAFKSTGKNLRLTVHQDASDVTTNVLKEYDGTLLKVADRNNDGVPDALTLPDQKKQCASCHATHYSSTNKKLFATGLDVANGSKCTDCHFPGDRNNLAEGGSFVKYGHGKASIGFGCSSCHSVNADHESVFPANDTSPSPGRKKMFGFSPDVTQSKYSKDLTSICKTCHPASKYTAHTGGGEDVGCIDCHDEHAEGVGSTSNRLMIPQYLPNVYPRTVGVDAELSFFQSDGVVGSVEPGVYDYFVADGNARKQLDMPGQNSAGVCDNGICHAGLSAGSSSVALSPLSTFMTGGNHTGDDKTAGSNCSSCHSHGDAGGSWGASNSCTGCHGQPPTSTATSASGYIFYASNADESKTPHRRHVTDYGFGCKECHFKWTSDDTHDDGTFESVWFDPARNPDAAAWPSTADYTVGTYPTGSVCNNLYCHSDGQNHEGAGASSTGSAQWMTGRQTPDWSTQDLACNSCHGTSTSTGTLTFGAPDHSNGTLGNAANSHDKHLFACAVCHNDTIKDTAFADGWTLATPLSAIPHVDGHKSLKANGTTATFDFTPGVAGAAGSCALISCHGNTGATWGGPSLSCSTCHFRTAANGGDRNNWLITDLAPSLIDSDEWVAAGHGRPSGTNYPSNNVEARFAGPATDLQGCLYCHDPAVEHSTGANPFRLRNRLALAGSADTAANGYGWNDVCLVCHSAIDTDGFDPDGGSTNYVIRNGKDVDKNHYGTKHADASKGGTFCWDCHDPHGDLQDFMLHSGNGSAPGEGVTMTSAGSGSSYYGVPAASRAVTGFDANIRDGGVGAYASADLVNGSYTGLCQTCHTTALYFNQNTNTALAGHNGADAARCTICHQHAGDFTAVCDSCHGTTGSNFYPDGGAQNGSGYENRAGAHQRHVAAIAARNPGVSADKAGSCNWCHPGGVHTGDQSAPPADVMNGTTGKFRTITGGTDADGAFVPASGTCTNVDCHAGATTPGWYSGPDTAAPVWTPNSGIAASNPGLGGVLNVSWNAATDAYPSNPVTYDLYRSTTNSAAAVFAGPPIATNLANTSAQVAGLTVGTTYYFGVRAKDNWITRNSTANTDISAGVAPGTNPWAPGSKTYYLTRSGGANLWTSPATTTNLNACGTPTAGLAVASAPQWTTMPGPATPPAGRGLLSTARVCGTASTNNYMESNASLWPDQYRNFAGFYTVPYPGRTIVQGSTATLGFQGYYNTTRQCGTDLYGNPVYCTDEEYARVVFAAVDSGGNTVARSSADVTTPALANAMTQFDLNLGTLSVTVPEGGRLAVLFYFYDNTYSGAATHRIAYDNYSATITNRITVNETLQDVSPPAWSGGVSGIVVQDAGTSGELDVFWNNATDQPAGAPANPVLYDLYRVQSASCTGLWSNRHQSGLVSPSFQDTGLTNGAVYCYGVRAKDSWVPPNVTANTDTATGTPSTVASFGCTGCHASPPVAGNSAGSHAAHANGDSDYSDCENCHPGTTSYTNGHQDGSGQLAFDGTAATAAYNGSQLSYTDNAQLIYNDPDGYGILTGSAGDGIDDGTCARARTSAAQCHGSGTVDPVWGGTLAGGCGACHDSTGKQASAAPTVTMTSSHTTAPAGANTCADCHAGHFKGVRIPLPPESWSNPNLSATNMRAQLGIAYATAGGIDLGGPGTVASISSKTTEADICWGCHDVGGQSEWGYNTKTTPGGYPVTTFATADGDEESENRGWIYTSTAYTTRTSDWTQGFWMSPYDSLMRRRIASVHTASFDPAGQSSSVAANVRAGGLVERSTPTLEYKGLIRCSYCHDVHDTVGPGGKPFLRGTWVGNPYPPELPPRSTYAGSYSNGANTLHPTPRGRSTAREKGGYFIDQNSNSPTSNASMDTLAETAGLCTLCHGSNVDTMNYYGSKLWLPGMSNGHANSTQGGSGAGKVNLFTGTRYGYGMAMQARVPGPGYVCGDFGGACDLTYPLSSAMEGSSAAVIVNSGWFGGAAGSATPGGGDYANWYSPTGVGGASGTGTKAHAFTCSKCHSPHATGLPALLIHSCIDPAQGDYTINGRSGVNLIANNCHRKTSTGDGWHILAPGE